MHISFKEVGGRTYYYHPPVYNPSTRLPPSPLRKIRTMKSDKWMVMNGILSRFLLGHSFYLFAHGHFYSSISYSIGLCIFYLSLFVSLWLYWTVLTLLNILDSIEQYLFLSNCLSLAICLCMAAIDSIEQSWVYWTVLSLLNSLDSIEQHLSLLSCIVFF